MQTFKEGWLYGKICSPQIRPSSAASFLIVFVALLCGFALVNLFWPKRENSELENRKLAQMPVFSVKTLLNGKWQDDFSTYLQDQVALRDGWINLKALSMPSRLAKRRKAAS